MTLFLEVFLFFPFSTFPYTISKLNFCRSETGSIPSSPSQGTQFDNKQIFAQRPCIGSKYV